MRFEMAQSVLLPQMMMCGGCEAPLGQNPRSSTRLSGPPTSISPVGPVSPIPPALVRPPQTELMLLGTLNT